MLQFAVFGKDVLRVEQTASLQDRTTCTARNLSTIALLACHTRCIRTLVSSARSLTGLGTIAGLVNSLIALRTNCTFRKLSSLALLACHNSLYSNAFGSSARILAWTWKSYELSKLPHCKAGQFAVFELMTFNALPVLLNLLNSL